MSEAVIFVKCQESDDMQGHLDYWVSKYELLLSKSVPPWLECQEVLSNIKRIKGVIREQ
jgi:hypothetical protein